MTELPYSPITGLPLIVYERPRNTATRSPRWLRTSTSYTPVRPARVTSLAVAVSTSPPRAGATMSIVMPDATVSSLYELQANANAESASVVISPPWQTSKPLSMSSQIVIDTVAQPGEIASTLMP